MKPEPSLPRSHVVMFWLAILSFAAFLLVPGEGPKTFASLFSALLFLVVMVVFMRRVFGLRPPLRWIVLAATAALANCSGQAAVFYTELVRFDGELARFNCLEARRIVATGEGFGRNWKRGERDNTWIGPAPFLAFHDLIMTRYPIPENYILSVTMLDAPRALGQCQPDPSATFPVHWN